MNSIMNLPEVWILVLEQRTFWSFLPFIKNRYIQSAHRTWQGACKERDLQIKNGAGTICYWEIKRWEVMP